MATTNPHRDVRSNPRCPKCDSVSRPHCPKELEGCRWNMCLSGHTFDLKTLHVGGEDLKPQKRKGTGNAGH